jgi:hypothetical protein
MLFVVVVIGIQCICASVVVVVVDSIVWLMRPRARRCRECCWYTGFESVAVSLSVVIHTRDSRGGEKKEGNRERESKWKRKKTLRDAS